MTEQLPMSPQRETRLFFGLIFSIFAAFSTRVCSAATPTNVQFTNVSSASVSLSWTLDTPSTEAPLIVLSTAANFSVAVASAVGSVGMQTTTYAVLSATTYYFEVKVSTEPDSSYSSPISTLTRVNLRFLLTQLPSASLLEGQTTAFFELQLWTDGGSMQWRSLKIGKSGTLADVSIQDVGVYKDLNGNGVFDPGIDGETSVPTVFSSSQATLMLLGASGETISTSTNTYFIGATLASANLPVDGATTAVYLNGTAFSVTGGVVQSPNFTSLTFTAADSIADVLASSAADIAPSAWYRSQTNAPVMKLRLWTPSDYVTVNQLIVQKTGTGADGNVAAVRIFLDSDGDGTFNPATDTALTPDQVFSGGIATFNFVSAGRPQIIGTSTQTYFIAWDLIPGAVVGATLGLQISATTGFQIQGTTDSVSAASFPMRTSTRSVVGANSDATASVSTGAWVGVSSVVFQGNFALGNVATYYYVWNQLPATSVDQGATPWSSGTLTIFPAFDANNWYLHVQAYDVTGATGTAQDLGPFWIDRTSPAVSGFLQWTSSGGALSESQANYLAGGVTVQITLQDASSGLNASGGFQLSYSTNAGTSWQTVASTSASVSPRIALSGVYGSTSVQTFQGLGLNFTQSANAQTCGGTAPCGATNQVKFMFSDVAGNTTTAGPFAVFVDTTQALAAAVCSSANAASAGVVQGQEAAMLRLTLRTFPGINAVFRSLTVHQTGSAPDADLASAEVYWDVPGSGVFNASQDLLLGSATMSGGAAYVNFGSSAAAVNSTAKNFFVVYRVGPLAAVGDVLGAGLLSSSDIGIAAPYSTAGPFPSASQATTIQDSVNQASFSAVNLAPAAIPPGSSNVPLLALNAQTSSGTSVLQSIALTLTGTAPSSAINAVRVWRDADGNGTFEAATDALLSSGSDVFSAGSATVTLTASQANRTIAPSTATLFVTVDISASAGVGQTFAAQAASNASISLADPSDTVVLSPAPAVSATVAIANNHVSVAAGDASPAAYVQGTSYAVLKASVSVDLGAAQLNRWTVNRLGAGTDADVSSARVYLHPAADGIPWNPTTDIFLGSAPFSGGVATISITTTSLSAGTTSVFFIVYAVSPSATAGDVLGAGMTNNTYVGVVSPLTSVSGNFPVSGSTGPIAAAVNHLLVSALDQSPGGLIQGATNIALLRLTVDSDFNPFSWSGLTVTRTGSGSDADVRDVKIYRDSDGNGILTGADALVTSGADQFVSGSAHVAFLSPQTVGSSTQAYFVAVDVDSMAVPGDAIGIQVSTSAAFSLNSPNAVSTAAVFPMTAGPVPVQQFANTVFVSTASIAPATAAPGAANVGMLNLSLNTNLSQAQWLGLRLDRAGSSTDADVSAVKLYYDVNRVGAFNPVNISQYLLVSSTGVSFGSAGAGSALLNISTAVILGPGPKMFYAAVDVSPSATAGHTIAARVLDATYFTMNAPNAAATAGFASNTLAVGASASSLYLTGASSAPASALQGSVGVPMLRLRAWMGASSGQWSGLGITESGTALDSDVSRVSLYADSNGDNMFEPLFDTLLATAAFSNGFAQLNFSPQTIGVSTATFFLCYDVSPAATAGRTIAASIAGPGAVTVATPNNVSNAFFPVASSTGLIAPTQSGVTVAFRDSAPPFLTQGATGQAVLSLLLNTTAQAALWNSITLNRAGTGPDSDVAVVHIFKDSNNNGALDSGDAEITTGQDRFIAGLANVFLAQPQAISVTPARYFVALDVNLFAAPGDTVGVTVSSAASLGVTVPNFVVNTGFPMATTVVPVAKLGDTLLSAWTDLMPAGVNQGAEAPMAKVSVSARRDFVNWSGMRVAKQGTLSDSFVKEARIYKDADGNGVFDAADVLIGTASVAAGQANVSFWTVQRLSTGPQTYFVNFVFAPGATIGATVGASVPDGSFFSVVAPDLASNAGLPFSGALAGVLDAQTPTVPAVSPRDPYWSRFDSIEFLWSSTVGSGTISSAQYAVGTTPGGTDTQAFKVLTPLATDFMATGLTLQNGATYYVSVKAVSSLGFTSPAGISGPILVDYTVPSAPATSFVQGANAVRVGWTSSVGGASGIQGYAVEYQMGTSPAWFNAKTGALFTASAKEAAYFRPLAVSTSDLVTGGSFSFAPPAGTVFIRVLAVGGSGVLGIPSDPMRLIFGALPPGGISQVSNYPNPFDSRREKTVVNYALSANSDVTIRILNIFGDEVREMSFSAGSSGGQAGANNASWDGTDDSGRKVYKGMYIAVIEGGGAKVTHKIGVIH